jgi:type IV pilus assembly protein PilQ
MLKGSLRFGIAVTLAFLVSHGSFARQSSQSTAKRNTIQKIERFEDAQFTRIRIHCSNEPTFTSFRLYDPARLFIDVAEGDIRKVHQTLVVENGVVDRVGTLSFKRDGHWMGRIIIGLTDNVAYDVQRNGTVIDVLIDATNRTQGVEPEKLSQQQEKLQAVEAQLAQELEKISTLRNQRAKLTTETATLQNQVQSLQSQKVTLNNLRAEATSLENQLSEARTNLAEAQEHRGALNELVEKLRVLEADYSKLTVELKRAQKSESLARTKLAVAKRALEEVQRRLAHQEQDLAKTQAQVERLQSTNKTLETKVNHAQTTAAKAQQALNKQRTTHDHQAVVTQEKITELRTQIATIQSDTEARKDRNQQRKLRSLKKQLEAQIRVEKQAQQVLEARIVAFQTAQRELSSALEEQKTNNANLKVTMQSRIEKLEARVETLRKIRTQQVATARAEALLQAKQHTTSELSYLNKQKVETQENIAHLRERRTAYEAELEEGRNALDENQTAVARIEKKRTHATKELHKVRDEVQGAETRLAKLKREETTLHRNIARLEGHTEELRTAKRNVQRELKQARLANRKLTKQVGRLETNVDRLQKRLKNEQRDHQTNLAKLSADRVVLRNKLRKLERSDRSTTKEQRQLRRELKRLNTRFDRAEKQHRNRISRIEGERNDLRGQLKTLRVDARSTGKRLRGQVAGLRRLLAEVQKSAARERVELENRARRGVQDHKSEIKRLRELLNSAEKRSERVDLSNALKTERRELKTAHSELGLRTKEAKVANAAALKAHHEITKLRAEVSNLRADLLTAQAQRKNAEEEANRAAKEAHLAAAAARENAKASEATALKLRTEATALRAELKNTQAQHRPQLTKRVQKAETAAATARAQAQTNSRIAEIKQLEAKKLEDEARALRTALNDAQTKIAQLNAENVEQRKATATAERARVEAENARAKAEEAQNNAQQTATSARAAEHKARSAESNALQEATEARSSESNALQEATEARSAESNALLAATEARSAESNALLAATEARSAESNALQEATEARSAESNALQAATEARKLAEEARAEARISTATAEKLRQEAKALRTKLANASANLKPEIEHKLSKAEQAAMVARAQAKANQIAAQQKQIHATKLEKEAKRLRTALADAQSKIADLNNKVQNLRENHNRVAQIQDISFEPTANGAQIQITADRSFEYTLSEDGERVDLKLMHVVLPTKLQRILDTRAFKGPILDVATYLDSADPTIVHVEVHKDPNAQGGVIRSGKRLVWAFRAPTQRAVANAAPATSPNKVRWSAHGVAAAASPAPTGGAAASAGAGSQYQYVDPYYGTRRRKRRYTGRKINLTIKDADILHVLTFLAKEGNINIITSEDVSGTVSFHFENVRWDLALEMVLKSKGLDYVKEEGVYRIAAADEIAKEFERELEKRQKLGEFKQLIVKLIPLNYADAKKISPRVEEILSSKGSVGVDQRTNTLIVKDIEEHVVAAEDLVRRLDTQTPQVLIEARIVESTDDFSKELGVQWGGGHTMAPVYGNETGLMFPATVGIAGGADDPLAPTFGLVNTEQPNFAVNMPAAAGLGSGGALSLSLASISGASTLQLRLSAAEEKGRVKIISSPRVSTMDNVKASIEQGVSIPISVVSANGVNTQFFQADLKLAVTPHVTPEGTISLKVDLTKNEPDFGNRGASGNPTIRRKEAHTQLLVKDGETAVIGGIYTRNTAQQRRTIPFFGNIPLLGWLFRQKNYVDKRSELLIFITPRIVNREASRPKSGP